MEWFERFSDGKFPESCPRAMKQRRREQLDRSERQQSVAIFCPCRRQDFQTELFRHLHHARDVLRLRRARRADFLEEQPLQFLQDFACIPRPVALILNHMVKCSPRLLNRTFAALADPTRRRILEHLAARRPLRHRSGAAIFHVAAGGFEAFARAGKRGIGPPATKRPGAFVEIGGQADAAGAGVDRGIPEILGRKL